MKRLNMFFLIMVMGAFLLAGCGKEENDSTEYDGDVVVIRVNNWEEYIDEGDWDEEELIDISDDVQILGVNPLYEDFEDWYFEQTGIKVEVEYSTFGTNEDLYNQLTLGDVYDLVCPSDYMIMKLMSEDQLVPFSNEFFDESNELNFYENGVSPYIKNVFEENKINGESWSKYAAGYMWGTTGIVYNPEFITEEEASSWNIFLDERFNRKLTIKDNVRDSLIVAMSILKADKFTDEAFINDPNYIENLKAEMNDTSKEAVQGCEDILKDIQKLAYSFETDAGKADMVTGKVYGNYQWSGDAVYTLDQADEDGFEFNYCVPKEASNLWFDGWVMLKRGLEQDSRKQAACEAFINYLSMPENVVRNMYYIGYTSCVSGQDDIILDYARWCYESEDESDMVDYDISYFFGREAIISTSEDQLNRQLFAQYPDEETMRRCSIMWFFDEQASKDFNQMWINVRCFDVNDAKVPLIILSVIIVLFIIAFSIYLKKHKIFIDSEK